MNLEQFVGKYQLRLDRRTTLRIPERQAKDWYRDDFPSVMGKYGFIRELLKPQSGKPSGRLLATILSEKPSGRRFGNAYHSLVAADATVHGRGDAEGSFIFEPEDEMQAKAALKALGARKRRIISEKQRAAARENMRRLQGKVIAAF